jgi:hypothetical protein
MTEEMKDVTPAPEMTPQSKAWNDFMLACAKTGQIVYSMEDLQKKVEDLKVQLDNSKVDQVNAAEKYNKLLSKVAPKQPEVVQ